MVDPVALRDAIRLNNPRFDGLGSTWFVVVGRRRDAIRFNNRRLELPALVGGRGGIDP